MFGRRVIAAVTSFAVAIAIGVVYVVPAQAVVPGTADQSTKDVDAALTSLSGFVGQLATNGQFAKQVPTLNLIPGSADGLGVADMVSATLAAAPLNGDLAGAQHLDDVANNLNSVDNVSIGGGRTVSIDASHQSAGGVDTIPIDFHLTRTTTVGLAVDTQTAPFAFTSTSGVDVTLKLDLHVDLSYQPGQGGAPGFAYLQHSNTTPSLTASIQSTALHPDQAKGAIGILGVQLNGTSTYSVQAHLKAAFADPNNDGKLAFKEPNGSGGFNPGELAGDGAPAGLVTVNFDTAQTNAADGQLDFQAQSSDLIDNLPTGSASVHVHADNLALPNPVTATYGPGALDTFAAFERLTPKDLADAVGSLLQMLNTAQLTNSNAALTDNINLPFMKGTLADVFQVSEALRDFLAAYVEQIPADPHSSTSKTIGKPRFSSIQELLGDLKNNPLGATLPAGATFSLPDKATYDNTTGHERLSLSLRISRSAPSASDLDPSAAPLSNSTGTGVVYDDTTLTDQNQSFDDSVVGRQVSAGGFTAAIASVSQDHKKLTLDPAPLTPQGGSAPASYWSGATNQHPHPDNGTPYIVTAADPQTGLVQLGDVLKQDSGVVKLNAEIPTAHVTPSYEVNLPVVLDLSPPTTTTPTTVTNPDGSSTVVAELPVPAQRVKIHTGGQLFWLDAPITAHFAAKATVGFLGVNASGDLAMCTTGFDDNSGTPACKPVTGATHLLSLSLVANPPKSDANGDISLPDLFSLLGSNDPNVAPQPESIFHGEVHGTAHATLRLTVPGAATFFGTDHADITLAMANVLNPTGVDVAGPDVSKLGNLSAFDIPNTDDPKALFGALLNALTAVDGLVQKVSGDSTIGDALKTNIPLLGTSVQQLIGGGISGGDGATYGEVTDSDGKQHGTIADPSLAMLSAAQLQNLVGRQISAGTVSGVVAQVDQAGHKLILEHEWQPTPAAGTSFTMADELVGGLDDLVANSADNLQDMLNRLATKLGTNADGSSVATFGVDTNSTPAKLTLNIDWKRGFEKTVPVQFKLDAYSLAGSDANGTISVGVDADLHLKLQFPLSAAAIADPAGSLKIEPSSGISVKAHADAGSDVFVKANVGPLAISLGDPSHPQATHVEAHAKLGVGLTDSTDSDPVAVTDFLSHLKPQLNSGVDPVQCNGAPEINSQHLAVCAALPIYTSPDGGTNWNLIGADVPSSAVQVRIPQQTGTDLAAQLDVTGTLADGTTDKIAVPANLLQLIASSFLDLSSLNDGLLGYLKFAQQSMQLASFNGQLPLVGKDLQQGADFLAKIRKALDDAGYATAGKGTSAGAYRNLVNKLGQQLDADGILPGGFNSSTFNVNVTCTAKLAKVNPAPEVTPTNGGTTDAHYQYKVVAVRSDNGGPGDTEPSDASTAVDNAKPADLNDSHFNHVTWAKSVYADHYKILRAVDTGSGYGNFELVATVGATPLSFDDKSTTSSAYASVGTEPTLTSVGCPDDAPGQDVDGISITTDLGTGNLDDPAASCTGTCVQTRPLSIGMPGLSFKAGDSGVDGNQGVTAALAWSLHLKFGLSRARGFYVATQDHGPTDPANKSGPEFKVGVALDLPSHMTAQLAFLNIDVAKHTGVTAPLFKGEFAIDLRAGTSSPDCSDTPCNVDPDQFIDLAKIQNAGSITDFVTPLLSAEASIDWDIFANTTVGAALPGIGAEFKLHWKWTNKTPGDGLPDTLEFDNVTIDPGEFLGNVLGKVFKQIADVTKPIQPIIDTIEAEIPVLSDLSKAVGGDPVTIASLAQTFSTLAGGPDIQPFIDVVSKVVKIAKALSGNCSGGKQFCVNVGSFDLLPDTAKTQHNTPDLATSPNYIQTTSSTEGANNPLKQLNDNTAAGTPDIQDTSGATHAGDAHPGFTFPAIQHPAQIFQLLMGHDVTLAQFDSGPLALGFSFSESFGPVYAPPPVNVVIQGSAGVTIHIVAGFDTYGIRKAVENKKVDVGVLDSLFFATTDSSGKPIPVVTFTGSIAAGAEVSAVIVKAGIVGGITLTVSFYWHDPDNDGKFRFSEFLATALSNPICLFDVGGELSLFIKVYITIGIDPFSVSFDFTLVNVKLLDFSLKPNCTPPPPQLGGVTGDTLYIYAGKLGTGTARGHDAWKSNNTADEAWTIREKTDNGAQTVTVTGLGVTHTFTQTIHNVVFDGRNYAGKLQVLVQNTDDLNTYVFGGNSDDTIKTGRGKSFVDGGGGNDSISTGDRPDPVNMALDNTQEAVVAGGFGKDTITTGNAKDWVAGDAALNVGALTAGGTKAHGYDTTLADTADNTAHGPDVDLSGLIDPAHVDHPATAAESLGANKDAADLITTGIGGGTIWGGGGNDKIGTSQASTVADANSGDATKKANLTPQPNTIIAGSGSDNVASGSASDFIYTGGKQEPGPDGEGWDDGANTINTVDTGSGNDTVYGSTGEDDVTVHSKTTEHATIYGGGGKDILDGGDGADKIYGGPDNDYLIAQPAGVDKSTTHLDQLGTAAFAVNEIPEANPSTSDKTLVGGGGSDRIYGGDGTSTIYGDHDTYPKDPAASDFTPVPDPCVSPGPAASDPPAEHPNTGTDPADGSPDAAQADKPDLILGGDGVDTVQAGGGGDFVQTFGAKDLVCGEGGGDTIDLGAGDDTAFAGSGDDHVFGQDGADTMYGNGQNDELYGQNGIDTIEGNDGTDTIFGGTDADLIVGGTRFAGRADEGDYLYGDTGQDTIVGDNVTFPSGSLLVADLLSGAGTLGGADWIYGGNDEDSLYGGLDDDHVYGGDANDYIEGNNGKDTIFGENGADNIIGGSAQKITGATMPDAGDTISGGPTDDVILGDNGSIDGTSLDDVLANRGLTRDRHVELYDTGNTGTPDTTKFGDDVITGDADTDAIFGEGGTDTIHGDSAGSTAPFDDYVEGGQGVDFLFGDGGQDDIVGGSYHPQTNGAGDYDAGDQISGGPDGDVVLGDNGLLTRITANASKLTKGRFSTNGGAPLTLRSIEPYDQGDNPVPGTSGGDLITGDAGGDVILGQNGNDRILGNGDSDYVEGDTGRDWIEGNDSNDDLVGGSTYTGGGVPSGEGQLDSVDVVFGGNGDDLVLGDNAVVNRVDPPNPLTHRIDDTGAPIPPRAFTLLDLAPGSARAVAGGDLLSGGGGTDVILGQDGDDQISGGANDDYAEGNGGHDTMWGDDLLAPSLIADAAAAATTGGLPAGPSDPQDVADPNGQDDLMGGSSIQGFRDTVDDIHGDAGADYEIGDNGSIVRDILDKNGTLLAPDADLSAAAQPLTNRVYTKRYAPTLPLGAAYVRHSDPNLAPVTRFCAAGGGTCEPATASGDDNIWGDAGDDTLYGQDGNDLMYGDNGATAGASDGDSMASTVDSSNDDDMYGELGDDRMWGEAGNDAMVGDRGGVVDQYEDGNRHFAVDVTQVPKIHFDGFLAGSVTRQTDLQHDVNGDVFVGSSTSATMPHPGDVEGGNDRMRGGVGHDSMHGGFGDDLMNGDSGGDNVLGDDGADVLWGGKGCDATVDTAATSPDCYSSGTFDPAARGTNDRMVDYVLGGKGATSGPSVDPTTGDLGADIIDWHPRGAYGAPGSSTCTANPWPQTFGNGKKDAVSVDPCSWFEMTNLDNADDTDNQHHQGIDWQYGGWDRDVLQADVADNGPNNGDRLLDWNGAYNLYTHCNSAYGGYNDVRQHSPSWQSFLQQWAFALGAGQISSDPSTGSLGVGTSAFDELALVYSGSDNDHGSGSAFPTTPGHFDNPNACAP